MSAEVEFSCEGCRRTFRRPRIPAMDLATRGASCQVCGGTLRFPPELLEAVLGERRTRGIVAFDLKERIAYSCPGCQRTFQATLERLVELRTTERTACQLCGGELELPDRVEQACEALVAAGQLTRVVAVPCVVCLRESRVDAATTEATMRCPTCGGSFRPPSEPDGISRPPAPSGPLASVLEVQQRVGASPEEPLARVLLARAERGELASAELASVLDGLRGLEAWPRAPHFWLPVEMAEAEHLVPLLLMPGRGCLVERLGRGIELVFTVDQTRTGGVGVGTAEDAFVNVVGLFTLATVGSGLFQISQADQDAASAVSTRLRVLLTPRDRGVGLAIATQVGAGKPSPVGDEAGRPLARSLVARRAAAEAYFGAIALFGGWVRGPHALAITPESAAWQLERLGGALAAEAEALAPAFCPGAAKEGQRGASRPSGRTIAARPPAAAPPASEPASGPASGPGGAGGAPPPIRPSGRVIGKKKGPG